MNTNDFDFTWRTDCSNPSWAPRFLELDPRSKTKYLRSPSFCHFLADALCHEQYACYLPVFMESNQKQVSLNPFSLKIRKMTVGKFQTCKGRCHSRFVEYIALTATVEEELEHGCTHRSLPPLRKFWRNATSSLYSMKSLLTASAQTVYAKENGLC